MKKLFALLIAVLMMVSMVACGGKDSGSDLEYIQKKGKLVVGITDYAPMDYKDENGEWIGFDADFAKLFAEELGVECEFLVLADWGQRFNELNSKNIDVIWNGMTISQDVLSNCSCSDPYVVNAQVVVMKADVAANYADKESVKDLQFAVEDGSVAEEVLTDMGITDYLKLQDMATALLEVKSGSADACVIDITMANAMTGEGTGFPDLAIAVALTEEEYGIGFRKGSDVTAKLNDFMKELMNDGTLDALAATYGVTLVKEN